MLVNQDIRMYMYVYIRAQVDVCVRVCEKEREGGRESLWCMHVCLSERGRKRGRGKVCSVCVCV